MNTLRHAVCILYVLLYMLSYSKYQNASQGKPKRHAVFFMLWLFLLKFTMTVMIITTVLLYSVRFTLLEKQLKYKANTMLDLCVLFNVHWFKKYVQFAVSIWWLVMSLFILTVLVWYIPGKISSFLIVFLRKSLSLRFICLDQFKILRMPIVSFSWLSVHYWITMLNGRYTHYIAYLKCHSSLNLLNVA